MLKVRRQVLRQGKGRVKVKAETDPNHVNRKPPKKHGKIVDRSGATTSVKHGGRPLRDIYPLGAPGMPPPGPQFLALAADQGDTTELEGKGKEVRVGTAGPLLTELFQFLLYAHGNFSVPFQVRTGVRKRLTVVSGHRWGEQCPTGPEPCRVMLIGKMLGEEEKIQGRNLCGPSGQLTLDTLEEAQAKNLVNWYVTNLIKTEHPEADSGNTTLRAGWVKEWLPLLHQEIRLVQPDYILCVGADASKALLGKQATITWMEGRLIEYEYPISRRLGPNGECTYKKALAMACTHPAQVLRAPEETDRFVNQVSRFCQIVRGLRWDKEEEGLDHRVIDTLEELKSLYYEINAECKDNLLGIDAEWHGEHPQNKGSYLRTIQISWKDKTAAALALRHPGGKWRFKGAGPKTVAKWVKKICKDRRIAGQFLNSDLEWLIPFGIDLRPEFAVADTWQETMYRALGKRRTDRNGRRAWRRIKPAGGFDTGLAYHAINETGSMSLTHIALRFTTAPRYDAKLVEWRNSYCNEHGLKKEDLEGFGDCPDKTLLGTPHPDQPGHYKDSYACLHGDSLVQLGSGCWEKISELVKQRYNGTVKAIFNGKIVNARVTNWHRHDVGQKEWYKLRTATTPLGRWGLLGPAFTPDHEIVTQRGKVRISDLICGEDAIATDERQLSAEQLSVFLGCLLGDGGFQRKNKLMVGFGFGQRATVAAYANWKASVFSTHGPKLRSGVSRGNQHRYETPFGRYWAYLSNVYPTHSYADHRTRKARITEKLLSGLGELGLAVWYQDDGTLVTEKRRPNHQSSRIYAVLPPDEQALVVTWLARKFGNGISYNRKARFVQIAGGAFRRFHAAIAGYMHPCMAYKATLHVGRTGYQVDKTAELFYDLIWKVSPYDTSRLVRCGNGVRYCLTVEGTGNFLTKIGFVSNCYDADVTRRLVEPLQRLLTRDRFGNNSWEAFWMSMRAAPAALEMTRTGVCIDRERLDRLTELYISAKARLEQDIRDWARWPELNINSVYQVREFLFGERFNGKDRSPNDPPIRQRPAKARSLKLKPLLTTDKRPMQWEEVERKHLEDQKTPGTDRTVLAILAQENQEVRRWSANKGKYVKYDFSKQITWIRDYRFISKVLQSTLRTPLLAEDSLEFAQDADGFFVYPGGLPASVCADGRVRTHFYQTKETGRWSSARPPLQNITKRRENDYRRILADTYRWPLRSVITAPPGCLMVEADYTGAELAGMAIMSGDRRMIEHARRNTLSEDHPDYYDIHSHVAIMAFGLKCEPTKGGLKSIEMSHMRIIAKNVIFGTAYGRGAKAIALAAKEEGVKITIEEAQQVIDTIFRMYHKLVPFFAACRSRATKQRWLCGCFGRFRRFPIAREWLTIGDFERQGMNFPIQGMIADMMSRACDHLSNYRKDHPDVEYKLALQLHDEVILQVPYEHVSRVVSEVLPECMVNRVPIYPSYLDGRPTGEGPYYLGIDVEPFEHWSEMMTPDRFWACGLKENLGKWTAANGGYVHPELKDKIWVGNRKGGKIKAITTT